MISTEKEKKASKKLKKLNKTTPNFPSDAVCP
jgi:hypothetical protein